MPYGSSESTQTIALTPSGLVTFDAVVGVATAAAAAAAAGAALAAAGVPQCDMHQDVTSAMNRAEFAEKKIS
jgi:hypothetical protein